MLPVTASTPFHSAFATPVKFISPNTRILPVSYLNRDGRPEIVGMPVLSAVHEDDNRPVFRASDHETSSGVRPLPEAAAFERLRHALVETGHLFVTTDDGLSRVAFAGIGDSDRLFVEVLPRDISPDALDPEEEVAGTVCSLHMAEAILRKIYEGETTAKLSARLNRLRRNIAREAIAA